MVKFRTLVGEAGGKGFGLLAMEPTSDLFLPPFGIFFYGGTNPDWTAPIGQPIKTLDQSLRIVMIGEGKKTPPPGPTFDWSTNQNYGPVLHISGRGQKLHPSFHWLVGQSIIIYYCIMALCHTFLAGKISKFDIIMTFQMQYLISAKQF